jgi:hypothetical protein
MRPPEIDERARQDAAWLVQLAIESVSVSGRDARVTGRVVRVFRGSMALLDSTLTLTVPIDRGDGSDLPRPGDLSRTPLEQLRPGRVLEAYLDDSEQGPRITLDLSVVLDAATDEARLPVLLAPAAAPPPRRLLGRIVAALIGGLVLGALLLLLR